MAVPAPAHPTTVRWTRSTRPFAAFALLALGVAAPLFWGVHFFPVNLALWAVGALLGLDAIRRGFFMQRAGTFQVEAGALQIRAGRTAWTLRGDRLVGASSSRGEGGWDLTLQARGQLPVTLHGLDEERGPVDLPGARHWLCRLWSDCVSTTQQHRPGRYRRGPWSHRHLRPADRRDGTCGGLRRDDAAVRGVAVLGRPRPFTASGQSLRRGARGAVRRPPDS